MPAMEAIFRKTQFCLRTARPGTLKLAQNFDYMNIFDDKRLSRRGNLQQRENYGFTRSLFVEPHRKLYQVNDKTLGLPPYVS